MEIKVTRVYLFGGNRVKELFEEGCKKDAKIRELNTAIKFQDVQQRGLGKEFRKLLELLEERKQDLERKHKEIGLLKQMYLESEKARQDLAEKLKAATELLEAAEERERERYGEAPTVACGDTSPRGGGKKGGEEE